MIESGAITSRRVAFFAGGLGVGITVGMLVLIGSRGFDGDDGYLPTSSLPGESNTAEKIEPPKSPRLDRLGGRGASDDNSTSNGSLALARPEDGTEMLGLPASVWNAAPVYAVRFSAIDGTPIIDGGVRRVLGLSEQEVGQIEFLSTKVAQEVAALMRPEPLDEDLAENESGFLIPPVADATNLRDSYALEIRALLGDARGYMFMVLTKRAWTYSIADFGTVVQKIVIRKEGDNLERVVMSRSFFDPITGDEVTRGISSSSIIPSYLTEMSGVQ